MKYKVLSVLLTMMLVCGTAFGWGSAGGDGSHYNQLQETAVFFNNSGSWLWTGAVVVFDLTGSNVETGTTLGAYVTTTTTDDSRLVAGVVKIAADDQMPVVVVTKGPVNASYYGATDPILTSGGAAVGTCAKAGYFGDGSKLGVMLEDLGVSNDGDDAYIWVDPHNSE